MEEDHEEVVIQYRERRNFMSGRAAENRRTIRGLLIEGVDFIGKTTVAEKVVAMLNSAGEDATMRKCYASGSPVVRFLDEEAARHEAMLERDLYYSAAIVLDITLLRPPEEFLVQDRHWLSQIGRNRFFHHGRDLLPDGLLEGLHIPFEFNVLLTSTLEAKVQRSAGRPSKSPRDRYLRENPAAHQEYETFLRRLLPRDERWLILDTTDQSADEVAHSILRFLDSVGEPSAEVRDVRTRSVSSVVR
jgi:thymidylate kinase